MTQRVPLGSADPEWRHADDMGNFEELLPGIWHDVLPTLTTQPSVLSATERAIEDALVIPETALHYRGEDLYVEIDGPEPEERRIEIGIVDGSRVEVLSGLAEGEAVRLK